MDSGEGSIIPPTVLSLGRCPFAADASRAEVKLERDVVDEGPIGPVVAPFYPKDKEESWWLVVGTGSGNTAQLLAIKRITMSAPRSSDASAAVPSLAIVCGSTHGSGPHTAERASKGAC